MTTAQLLISAWEWHPSVVIGCLALLAGYLAAEARRLSWRSVYFVLGDAILLITLCGPLDPLSDDYLFSAHMLQHVLLILVVPPLLLLAISDASVRRLLRVPALARIERVLSRPVLAWTLGIGTLLVWHVPVLYNAALDKEWIHIFQHLTFLVTATIFWWPLLCHAEDLRLPPVAGMAYVALAAVANTLLGIFFTFAPVGYFPHYLHPDDELGALALIRHGWGLDPLADQQAGGVLMWVVGGLILLWALLVQFARWYNAPEPVETES